VTVVREAGLLLLAHGSRDPRAPVVANDVAKAVSRRDPELTTAAAFIELSSPDPDEALDSLVSQGVREVAIVPFLLSHAYHSKVDLPKVARTARERGLSVRIGEVLGPDPLLLDAVIRRLGELGTSYGSVVLAAAGSSDPEAVTSVHGVGEALDERLGLPVTVGFASAAGPTVGEAVRIARAASGVPPAVATYLLAPGYFGDSVRSSALEAGAVAVSDPLGCSPEIVELAHTRGRTATA
jgi:sirohydrochlorin ferrochelatase